MIFEGKIYVIIITRLQLETCLGLTISFFCFLLVFSLYILFIYLYETKMAAINLQQDIDLIFGGYIMVEKLEKIPPSRLIVFIVGIYLIFF